MMTFPMLRFLSGSYSNNCKLCLEFQLVAKPSWAFADGAFAENKAADKREVPVPICMDYNDWFLKQQQQQQQSEEQNNLDRPLVGFGNIFYVFTGF